MSINKIQSGFATVEKAKIYYETAGSGTPFVMIHAGVADSRQWNNEFAFFTKDYQAMWFIPLLTISKGIYGYRPNME